MKHDDAKRLLIHFKRKYFIFRTDILYDFTNFCEFIVNMMQSWFRIRLEVLTRIRTELIGTEIIHIFNYLLILLLKYVSVQNHPV